MSDRVVVTSQELRDASRDVRSTGAAVQGELDRMRAKAEALTSSWQGQASASFAGFYTQMNQGWSQVRDAMEGIAKMLDGSAQAYDENEAGIAGQFKG